MARTTTTTTTGNTHSTAGTKVKRGAKAAILGSIALLNLLVYTIIIALGSHLFDSWVDGKGLTPLLFNARRPQFIALLMFSLLAGAVGFAVSLYGLLHAASWHESARNSNLAVHLIQLALIVLAGGFAIKVYEADTGSLNKWPVELRTLGAFDLIASLLTLFYVLALAALKHDRHDVNTVDTVHTHGNTNNNNYNNNSNVMQTGKAVPPHHNVQQQQAAQYA